MTMPGIGDILAMTIMLEVGSIRSLPYGPGLLFVTAGA